MDNDNEYDRNVKYQNYREIVSKGAIDDHKT
jgi:hypothetical protein